MSPLYRLVYASKNLLEGTEAEVAAAVLNILEASQRNNVAQGVTGALMFNSRAFAQVLEGPRHAVEATFERIQRDTRHNDATVLHCGPAETRGFPNWSMAFVGQSPRGRVLWNGVAAESGFDLARLDGDKVFAMLHELVLDEEGLDDPVTRSETALRNAQLSVATLPVDQIRTEIAQLRTGNAVTAAPTVAPAALPSRGSAATADKLGEVSISTLKAAEAALIALRSALADERQRTTALRNEVDSLQIALALSRDEAQMARAELSLWAGRARLLAETLGEKAEAVSANARRSDLPTMQPAAASTPGSAA